MITISPPLSLTHRIKLFAYLCFVPLCCLTGVVHRCSAVFIRGRLSLGAPLHPSRSLFPRCACRVRRACMWKDRGTKPSWIYWSSPLVHASSFWQQQQQHHGHNRYIQENKPLRHRNLNTPAHNPAPPDPSRGVNPTSGHIVQNV